MNKLLTKIVGVVLGTTMAVGVGVGVAVNNNRDVVDSQVNAADPGNSIYTSGTPSWGTNYSYGNRTLNGVDWYFTNYGNNSSMGWNKASGEQSGQTFGPLTGIGEAKKIGAYQTSAAFPNAQKISVSVSNLDSVSGTWYIWYSTDSGTNWTEAATAELSSSTDEFTYDNGSKIGDSVYFAFGYGTSKTTKTRINLINIEVWEAASAPATYSVSYNANGATSGDVPTDGTSYSSGATVTVIGNTGSLAKTGFTWAGWNTQADGNGTDYAANATFSISTNTTLYAKWIKTLDAITAIGGTVIGSVSNAGTYNWDFSNLTVTGTLSGVSGQNVKSYVDLSSTTAIPGATTDSINVSVTATKKESVTGSATSYTNNAVSGSVEAAKLTYSVTFSYTEMWSAQDVTDKKIDQISYANETSHVKTSSATCAGHDSFDINWGSNNVMNPGGNSNLMQFRSSSSNLPYGYIYNTTELPGTITNLTLNGVTAGAFNTFYGDSENPTSNTTVGGKFFTVQVTSAGLGKAVSVTVEFQVSDKPKVQLVASNMNLDVASGAATPTITDGTNPVSGYDLTSNDDYIASITQDKKVQPAGYGKATITVTKAEDSGHIYVPTTFTVTVGDNSKQVSIMEFTEAAGGSATAADGIEWTIQADQNEQPFSNVYGINYGSANNPAKSLVLTTPANSQRIIKNVVIEAMSASGTTTIAVSVENTAFTCSKSNSLDGNVRTFNFSGNLSGAITITISSNGSSKLGVKSINVLYVGDAATSFASTFLGAISCDADGINKPTFTIKEGSTYWTWSLLETEFNSLSAEDKAKFAKNAAAVNDTITAAIARYDYIVGKYYVGGLDTTLISSDFMNRTPSVPSGMNRVNTQSIGGNSSTVATVIIISVISLSTLCGYFLLRKRKEER